MSSEVSNSYKRNLTSSREKTRPDEIHTEHLHNTLLIQPRTECTQNNHSHHAEHQLYNEIQLNFTKVHEKKKAASPKLAMKSASINYIIILK